MSIRRAIVMVSVIASGALGQTSVNLASQGKNADFSNLPFTRPVSVGQILPATCKIGQLFFFTAAPQGPALYGCGQSNTWAPVSPPPQASTSAAGSVMVPQNSGLSLTSGAVSVLYGTTAGTALQGSVLGQANGAASLDSLGRVPLSQLNNLGTAAFQSTAAFEPAGTANAAVAGIPVSGSSTSQPGLLSPADWLNFNNKQNALGFSPENLSNKGQANGYASLDTNGRIPAAQLGNLGTAAFLNSAAFDAAGSAASAVASLPTSGISATQPALITPADWTAFNNKQNALGFSPENPSNKGQANGYAALNGSGQVPTAQLPAINLAAAGSGGVTGSLPASSVSGLSASATLDATNAANIATGTLAAARLPFYNRGATGSVNRTISAKLQDVLNVLDFGADPTGATDSTSAIQAAINATTDTLMIPAGTYKISTSSPTVPFFTLKSGIRLVGNPGSILQVKSGQGAYTSIMQCINCSNVTLEGLSIDANIANNTIGNLTEIKTYPRIEIVFFGGSNIKVSKCLIRNSSAVNSIDVNPGTNVVITENIFSNMGDDPNHISHDSSAIYANGQALNVANNVMSAATSTVSYNDVSMTAGQNTLTSAALGAFRLTNIGSLITVTGAGPSGTTLSTNIYGINGAMSATLASNAATTVSNATATITTYAGSVAATTGIEVHGYPQTVTGNTIVGFGRGANLTGSGSYYDNSLTAVGNNFEVLESGIDVWSNAFNQHSNSATSYGVSGAVISGNTIRVHQFQYSLAGTGAVLGISCDPTSNMPMRNVNISNNTVQFDLEAKFASQSSSVSVTSNVGTVTVSTPLNLMAGDLVRFSGSATTGLNGTFSVQTVTSPTVFTVALPAVANGNYTDGIVSLVRQANTSSLAIGCTANIASTNVHISGNVIDNPPVAGIRMSGTLSGLSIENNTIRNAGTSMDSSGSLGSYKIPVFISSTAPLHNVSVSSNKIIDDQTTSVMTFPFYLSSGAGATDVRYLQNVISLLGTSTSSWLSYFTLDSNAKPLVTMTVASKPWTSYSGAFANGSSVYDQTTQTQYQVYTDGGSWIATATGSPVGCHRYSLSNNGTNWTLAVDGGSPVVGLGLSSAVTQNIPLFTLAANGVVTGTEMHTTNAWTGSGFTSLTATVGDSVGGTTLYGSTSYNLMNAAGNTNFQSSGPLFLHGSYAGSQVQAVITANQSLLGHSLTGSTDFSVCWAVRP